MASEWGCRHCEFFKTCEFGAAKLHFYANLCLSSSSACRASEAAMPVRPLGFGHLKPEGECLVSYRRLCMLSTYRLTCFSHLLPQTASQWMPAMHAETPLFLEKVAGAVEVKAPSSTIKPLSKYLSTRPPCESGGPGRPSQSDEHHKAKHAELNSCLAQSPEGLAAPLRKLHRAPEVRCMSNLPHPHPDTTSAKQRID